jgi:hypothetical protein
MKSRRRSLPPGRWPGFLWSPARLGGTGRAWAGLPPDQVVSLPATSLSGAFAALGRFTMLSSALGSNQQAGIAERQAMV